MKHTLFDIPQKYFISDEMAKSLGESPLRYADVGGAMGIEARWELVANFLDVQSFEPDTRSIADGKVFRTALGAEKNTERTLNLSELPAASSFFESNEEMDRFVVHEWLKKIGETSVPVTTLDSCLEGKDIDFLKIDVEGADLEVLQGATETLNSVLGIQVEVSFASRHKNAPRLSEIELFLRDRGFQLHSISNEYWLRKNATFGANTQPQLIWGDAVFLKSGIHQSDYAKWALIFQAYGFHDLAIDRLPPEWHEPMKKSVLKHGAFFFSVGWRLALATILIPFYWAKAWRKWKSLAAIFFGELHRLAKRTGPQNGIFTDE